MQKTNWNDGDTHLIATVDAMTGDTVVRTYQNVEAHLKACADERRANREHTRYGRRGEFRKALSIPFNVLMEISSKYHLNFFDADDSKKILKIARSSEYKKLRTYDKGS